MGVRDDDAASWTLAEARLGGRLETDYPQETCHDGFAFCRGFL
jgi:hypothetical protein